MEGSTESGVTDVDLLTEALSTLSTAFNEEEKETCPMQNQSTQLQVSLEIGKFSCIIPTGGFFSFLIFFRRIWIILR